jgi:hypothetical protein
MFGLDNIIKSAIQIAAPIALNAVFPGLGAALGPAVANIATEMLGSALSNQLGQMGREGIMPKFLAGAAQDILKQVVGNLLQPVDKGCADHVRDKCGDSIKSLIDNLMKDFKDALTQYLDDSSKKGQGKGGCGKPGAGGAGSTGNVGFRELAAILAELESKQAKNVKDAVIKASDALGVAKTEGKSSEDLKKNAEIEADQFKAMENSKAEAQIFQALSSAISEVMKNFGGALNTAARGG